MGLNEMLNEMCKQRWDAIKELEESFLENPNENDGITLSDLWDNWLSESCVKSNMSGAIAGPRVNLFYGYTVGNKSEVELTEYLRKNPMPEF